MRRAVAVFSLICAGMVLLGLLGAVHRAFDTVSMLRPVFGALGLMCLFALRSAWLRRGVLAVCAWTALSVAWLMIPQSADRDLRVYSKNLWYANAQIPDIVADIRAADPDIVVMQEVSWRNDHVLRALAQIFPHQHVCDFSAWSDIAVLSRTPFVGAGKCSSARAAAAVPISVGGQEIWVAAVHIPWPWPEGSGRAEAAAMALLAEIDKPVVVAGDFNIFPWSGRVQRIARMTGTRLAGPIVPTLSLYGLPLPIDMVLAPKGGRVETRPLLGSDHRGILADIAL